MTINNLGANSRGADMSEGQADKYQTHNDHVDLLSDSVNKPTTLDIGFAGGSGEYQLSAEDYTGNGVIRFRSDGSPSADADWTLVLPATFRRIALMNDTAFNMAVRSAGSPTGNTVSVVPGGRVDVINDGENIEELKRDIYDIGFFANTWTFDAIFGAHIAARAFTLPDNGHQGYAWVPSSAIENARVMSVQKNDVEVGTITFDALASTPTFAITETTFAAGDRLSIVNGSEGSPDDPNTLADVAITLKCAAL